MNATEADIDITVWEWAKSCTGCHPGGGGVEIDRDGYRYDERVENGPEWAALDGDYHRNNWATSGVIEADCLLCHMSSYRTAERTPQLKAANFRVAPVAGAFMGTPRDNEIVDYDTTWELYIQSPSDRSCSQCHAGTANELFNAAGVLKADIAKRGRSWDDQNNRDVHDVSLNCVSCHHAGTSAGQAFGDHQFQKGHIMVGSAIRDDLDNKNGWRGCQDCHGGNAEIADLPVTPPVPSHEGMPGFHLDRIDCATCHIPNKDLFAVSTFDFTQGTKVPSFIGGNPKNPYGGGIQPAYLWWHSETEEPYQWKIYPFNYITSVIWNRGDERAYGLHLPDITPVYNQLVAEGKLTDDIPDAAGGIPEANTAQEINDMIAALAAAGLEDPQIWLSPEPFQLSHNVKDSMYALGSGGCTDCHRTGSDFFSREVLFVPWDYEDTTHVNMEVHIHDPSGVAATIEGFNQTLPMWRLLGYTESRKIQLETLFEDDDD